MCFGDFMYSGAGTLFMFACIVLGSWAYLDINYSPFGRFIGLTLLGFVIVCICCFTLCLYNV